MCRNDTQSPPSLLAIMRPDDALELLLSLFLLRLSLDAWEVLLDGRMLAGGCGEK
jgi:hypothetical protein